MTILEIAKQAYETYKKTILDDPSINKVPPFDELPKYFQDAWCNATLYILLFAFRHSAEIETPRQHPCDEGIISNNDVTITADASPVDTGYIQSPPMVTDGHGNLAFIEYASLGELIVNPVILPITVGAKVQVIAKGDQLLHIGLKKERHGSIGYVLDIDTSLDTAKSIWKNTLCLGCVKVRIEGKDLNFPYSCYQQFIRVIE